MEENKKLETLLNQARSAPPTVSFSEAKAAFEEKLSASIIPPAQSSSRTTSRIVALAAILLVGAGAYYFTTKETPEQAAPEVAATSVAPVTTVSEKAEVKNEATSPAQNGGQNAGTKTTDVTTEPVEVNSRVSNEVTEAEKKLFVEGDKRNIAVAPKYKTVEGYEKTKTEALASDARITSSTRVGLKQNVSITNSSGKFNLHFLNGELNELVLNDVPVEKSNWKSYTDVIAQGKKKIGATSETNSNTDFMPVLLAAMVKENLVNEATHKIVLTKDAFTINGVAQDVKSHAEYLELYKKTMGSDIGKNSVKINR